MLWNCSGCAGRNCDQDPDVCGLRYYREPLPLATLPIWPWFLPFPEVGDDVEACAKLAARTHVVTHPR